MAAIFLLSWLVMAWIVAAVLFLASFPEKVAWLDRWIESWRKGRDKDRYVTKDQLELTTTVNELITLQVYFTPISRLDFRQHRFSGYGGCG